MSARFNAKACRAILLLASVSPAAMAHAQTAAPAVEEIVVTGSRVVANGNQSPTPVTVIAVEQMQDVKPATIAEQLNELPQFAGSQSQNSGIGGGSANGGNPNGQGNVLNLRNFGLTRNLVLYDGHRVAPNSPNGTVDVDMIPQFLLKRVDIVTGGASAVYGADAVTGVVNFVTDTTFNGFKMQGQAGVSSRGDGRTRDIGLGWGGNVGDRLHLLASYQYRGDDGIAFRSDRAWGAARYQIGNLATQAVPGTTAQRFVTGAARSNVSFGGTVATIGTPANPLNGLYFSAPNVLTAQATGDFVNANAVGNGSGAYFNPSLRGELEFHQGFGRADFDVTENVKAYARGAYTKTRNAAFAIGNPTYQASDASNVHAVFANNPYLPATYAQQMATAGITRFGIGKLFSGPGQDQFRQYTEAFGENYSIDLGLQGDVKGWKWEVAVVNTRNEQRVRQNNAVNGRKVAASIDAVIPTGGGAPVCYVSTIINSLPTNLQNLYRGCVPLATLFGGALTPAEADWLFDPLEVTTTTRMTDVEAFISGSPFSLPAGPVNVAISGQARKQNYQVVSTSSPATLTNPLDCTGLRLITCRSTSLEYFQAESLSRSKISVDVKEAAIEVQAPLLRDVALAESLNVNGAYRITDYSTSGRANTWKAGVDWSPISSLRFRGTRSRDIRAPTMHELYAPQNVGNYNGLDVLLNRNLDGAAGNPTPAGRVESGNANLKPERADTLTVGAVFRPDALPGLSIAIDYFDITVKDAIFNLAGDSIASQADCIASNGTSATCSLIIRSVDCCTTKTNANAITRALVGPINIGRQYTKGVDTEVNYVTTVMDRAVNLRGLFSYQPKNVFVDGISGLKTNVAGAAASGFAGFAHAKWRGTIVANAQLTDNLRVSVSERYRGKMDWYPTFSGVATVPIFTLQNAPKNVPARWYTNVNVAFKTGPGELFVNVQNLFDQAPAPFASYNSALPGNNGVAPGDDPIGRYYTVGFRVRL